MRARSIAALVVLSGCTASAPPPAPEAPPPKIAVAAQPAAPSSPPAQMPAAAPAAAPAPSPAPEKVATAPEQAAPKAPPKPAPPAPKVAAPAPTPAAPAAKPAAPPPLDLKSLEDRLKDTSAIGVLTKLSLKNQVDDLVGRFKAFHGGQRPPTLGELRPAFELLLMKVLSLLQDKDGALARDINASRESIWGVLADQDKFARYTS